MPIGKVPGTVLKRSVVNLLKCPRRTGLDAATFPYNGGHILTANAVGLIDSIIAPDLAVYKAVNNVLAAGGRVLGVEASFILPKSYNEYQLKAYTKRVKAACEMCHTTLSGGHTEVSDAVKRFCISVTAIGVCDNRLTQVNNIEPDMDIVVTKWIGLEEAAILIERDENKTALREKFSEQYLRPVFEYINWLCVEDEAIIALDNGVIAMHDISEGGIFTALWDLAEGSGCGLSVDLRKIPIRQDTVEVMEFFHINPYKAKSSGSMLMVTKNGSELVKALEEQGIPAVVIGTTTDNNDKIIHNEDEIRFLDKN